MHHGVDIADMGIGADGEGTQAGGDSRPGHVLIQTGRPMAHVQKYAAADGVR